MSALSVVNNPYAYYNGSAQYYVQRLLTCDKYGIFRSGKRYDKRLIFVSAEEAHEYLDELAALNGWKRG